MADLWQQEAATAAAARLLISLGWPSVLPLPYRRKANPPEGFTGHTGRWPDAAQHDAWWGTRPVVDGRWYRGAGGGLALRLPATVVGLDFDLYKPEGEQSYRRLVAECGPLPRTWAPSSRDDGSGIRLYRVPPGVRWAERRAGPGIEIIHTGHRYVVAPPSIHPEGRRYEWHTGPRITVGPPPAPDDLPELPAAWGRRLSEPPAPPVERRGTHQVLVRATGYAAATLAGVLGDLRAMRAGDRRNESLNRAGYVLGGLVAAGELDEREVREALLDAARVNGHVDKHGMRQTLTTIDSGLRAGIARPRAGATR